MEISETVLYIMIGFVPTILALEASWRLAIRKGIGTERPLKVRRD